MTSPVAPQSLAPDEVHVWWAPLRLPVASLNRLRQLLSQDERDRAQQYRARLHQDRFVAARGFLRLLLAGYLGTSPDAVSFTYSAQGKPALDSPSPSFSFNLAHSEEIAVCALTPRSAVGVDVERIRTNFNLEQLAEDSFSSYEVAVLRSLPEHARTDAFFRCWTRKEAYIKARGEGLAIPLRDFDVTLAPDEPALLLASREDPAAAQRWQLHDLSVCAGYAGALAVEGGTCRLSCRAWSWDEGLTRLSVAD